MSETEKIILGDSLSKESKNENMSLNLNISGNKRILPDSSIDETINEYDIYLNERTNSNKFRLTVSINPYCSNVLFNPFTEIVKYYTLGDETKVFVMPHKSINNGVTMANLISGNVLSDDAVIGKNVDNYGNQNVDEGGFLWNSYKAIRDTQLSNEKCGFEYYCGIDIFNNHIFRSKTHRPVTYTKENSEKDIMYLSNVYANSCKDGAMDDDCAYNRKITGVSSKNYKYIYTIDENFNTIDDYMRDRNGVIVVDNVPCLLKDSFTEITMPIHLYQSNDVMSFEKTINSKLIEKNGWFGFFNESLVNTSSINYNSSEDIDINKVINNKKCGNYIDMYPTRDLFTFSPLYNKHKKRLEKNWNYYLTYPSKSITKMLNGIDEFSFFHTINKNGLSTISLKALMIDEYTVLDDGRNVITIYSICQHGLTVGDKINLYVERNPGCKQYKILPSTSLDGCQTGDVVFSKERKCNQYKISTNRRITCEGGKVKFSANNIFVNQVGDGLVYSSAEVVNVYDKYVFQILKTEGNISNKWVDVSEITDDSVTLDDGRVLTKNEYYLTDGNKKFPIAESYRCNVDDTIESISFKRVVNNVECEYYVREFDMLPNFKFADSEINDETLYGKYSTELNLIERYSNKNNSFENHISDESFARTSYGDNNTEIVYSDDIDISYLRDNLGRPLSDIYLTIVKNNKGYKEWYGIGMASNVNDDAIEMSHCFGKNNCSFLLSEYYRNVVKDDKSSKTNDVRDISVLTPGLIFDNYTDEIDEYIDKYYGDICCYSPIDCDEYVIQSVHNRFNTVQRELTYYGNDASFYGGNLYYDEILDDENKQIVLDKETAISLNMHNEFNGGQYDSNRKLKYRHSTYNRYLLDGGYNMLFYKELTRQNEGYFYKSHYKIKLKTISETLDSAEPITFDVYKIFNKDGILNIKTTESNYLEINDKLILYVKDKNMFYYLTVNKINDEKYFECYVENENYEDDFVRDEYMYSIENISLFKKPYDVPYYAKIIKDGSCRYYWRNIISNGIENNDSKIYPFTNGAFYINKRINFYLKRQDPYENGNYYTGDLKHFIYIPAGEMVDVYGIDNYYEADEMEDCKFDLSELLNI